jgi:hypothetical protein
MITASLIGPTACSWYSSVTPRRASAAPGWRPLVSVSTSLKMPPMPPGCLAEENFLPGDTTRTVIYWKVYTIPREWV